LRILLVSDFSSPTPGGLESHVERLAGALIERGHAVALVTGTPHPDPLPGLSAIAPASTLLGRSPQLFHDNQRRFHPPFPDAIFRRAVRRVAEAWQPDLIHAHGWCAFSCYWPSAPPLVVSLHDHGLRCPKRTLLRDDAECTTGRGSRCITCKGSMVSVKRLPLAAAMRYSIPELAAHTSRFVAVSKHVKRRVEELGLVAPMIQVVPNFVDMSETADIPLDDPTDGLPLLLYVGPDSPHKGRAILIEAFSRLPVGCGRLSLVGAAGSVDVPGVRTYGYVRNNALAGHYRQASVVVVPSIWPDPCPTVILEAMAYGRPVVASRIGGIPELVEDGVNGLLVRPHDPAALARGLLQILTDGDARRRLGIGARNRAWSFSTSSVVPRLEEVYLAVCGTGAKG